jgi:hypothetical protein
VAHMSLRSSQQTETSPLLFPATPSAVASSNSDRIAAVSAEGSFHYTKSPSRAVIVDTPILTRSGIQNINVVVSDSAMSLTAQPRSEAFMQLTGTRPVPGGAGINTTSSTTTATTADDLEPGDSFRDEGGESEAKVPRLLAWYHLVPLLYFWTSGGPFGIEPSVRAAGPLACVLGLALMAPVWALPQSLMSAELALAIDDNGGQFYWVLRAFGAFASWMNGWTMLLSNFVSTGLVITLIVLYIPGGADFSFGVDMAIKLGVTTAVMLVNFCGATAVSKMSIVAAPMIVGVFVVLGFAGYLYGKETQFTWKQFVDDHPSPFFADNEWGVFLSTQIWCFGGFDSIGSAGWCAVMCDQVSRGGCVCVCACACVCV